MLPFVVDKLLVLFRREHIKNIRADLSKIKYNFCMEFEKELKLTHSLYPENVFDFIYNIHYLKQGISSYHFKLYLQEIKDIDYSNKTLMNECIFRVYKELILTYKDYVLNYMNAGSDRQEDWDLLALRDPTQFKLKIKEFVDGH
jgi:hypothetical protein